MNFFQKFKELEIREGLQVAESPKITAVVTFEQTLFYNVKAEDLEAHSELRRQITDELNKKGKLSDELNKELELNPEYKELLRKTNRAWKTLKGYAELNKRLRELRTKLEQEGNLKRLAEETAKIDEIIEALMERKSRLVTITPNIAVPNLKTYGVLDYTTEPSYETWDERRVGGCIGFLTDKLLDDLSEFGNDEIEQIIFFSGLHAKEYPYHSAMRVSSQRKLERGKVQVYSTMSAQPPRGCSVEVLKKEREDLCKRITSFAPSTVVRIEIPAGYNVEQLQKIIRGENA